jgi:hypothetical protein
MPIRHDLLEIFSQKKRQCWMLLGYVTLLLSGAYYFSAYWAAHKLMKALEAQDILKIKKEIPDELLVHLIPKVHYAQHWQGAGHNYLQHVEPRLYAETNRDAWLAIQAQVQSQTNTHHYYAHYFNHYRLDLGSDISHDQIRIEFERTTFMKWHVIQVCYPNPQPDWVENRCPSSKR